MKTNIISKINEAVSFGNVQTLKNLSHYVTILLRGSSLLIQLLITSDPDHTHSHDKRK